MTKEEYFKKAGSVIGLCELCKWFHLCDKQNKLKEYGCNDYSIDD